MTIDEAINKLATCATDMNCPREEACFLVAMKLKELLAQARTDAMPEPDPDLVAHYAPTWEATDWSAA